jgi:hypothetical protein
MKILDIISEDKALNEGAWTKWFTRPFTDYMEKRAAAKLIAEIEKKYANDIAKQTACKELSEKYGKYLAERELAGQKPIPLERLILKQEKYAGTSFASDAEFIDLTTRLAQIKKTQYLKDGAQAGKDAGKTEPGSSPAAGSVTTTVKNIEDNEELRKRVSERIKWITTTYRFMLGGQFALILAEWGQEDSTIEAQARLGKIPESDAPYFPPVTTPGVAVSSNAQYATQWKMGAIKTNVPYSYDNETARVQCWEDWRRGMNSQTLWQKIGAFTGSIIISGKLISVAGKTKWMTDFAKWLDAMDKNTGVMKKTLGMTLLGATALLNKAGQLIFVNKMSSDEMNEVFKSVMMGNLLETVPEAAKRAIGVAFDSTVLHQGAILIIANMIKNLLGVSGNVIPPRTKEADPTSDVDAADPMQQDPSQKSKPPESPVDKTDSSNSAPEKQPEAPATNTPVVGTTATDQHKAFSAAKNAGQPTVVINGVTYYTNEFKSDGKYWTNDDGKSFLKY